MKEIDELLCIRRRSYSENLLFPGDLTDSRRRYTTYRAMFVLRKKGDMYDLDPSVTRNRSHVGHVRLLDVGCSNRKALSHISTTVVDQEDFIADRDPRQPRKFVEVTMSQLSATSRRVVSNLAHRKVDW